MYFWNLSFKNVKKKELTKKNSYRRRLKKVIDICHLKRLLPSLNIVLNCSRWEFLYENFFKRGVMIWKCLGEHIFLTSTQKRDGPWKFTCLRMLLFLNNRFIAHFCKYGRWQIHKIVFFCGRHKYATLWFLVLIYLTWFGNFHNNIS